jgi:hypothetical protein
MFVGAFLLSLLSFVGGAACVYFAVDAKRRKLVALDRELQERRAAIKEGESLLSAERQKSTQESMRLGKDVQNLHAQKTAFEARVVQYDELAKENGIIKADLHRIAMTVAKQSFETEQLQKAQALRQSKADDLGRAYLSETRKWIEAKLAPDNYVRSKQRLQEAFHRIRAIGAALTEDDERAALAELQSEYELVVRAALEREEQARIRAKIRDDQQRERDLQRLQEESERERRTARLIEEALVKARKEADGTHSAEVARLQAELANANAIIEQSERAISQAQITKAGNVYVISNIGSFGQDVYKIGMTRRLEPMDRVRELGDASVPFPFDVHMMISCNDAPKLENALHRAFHKQRINKTNPRKEFFRATINEIAEVVKNNHGEVKYTADAEALQYRQSLTMNEEDMEVIEHVFEDFEKQHPNAEEE